MTTKIPARVSIAIMLFAVIFFATPTAYAQTTGACGATLNWNYNEATQTITISRTGNMYD
jgi:hypothetical protein